MSTGSSRSSSSSSSSGKCSICCMTYVCREQERALVQAGMPSIQPHLSADQARFTGGGFNLRQTPGNTNSTIAA